MPHGLDAYCPHLGADLGTHGALERGRVRCGFHGFCFNAQGTCVGNAYGSKTPRKTVLKSYHVVERNGFILMWHHPEHEPSRWEVPELSQEGRTGLWSTVVNLNSHPQETTENRVGFGHFTEVHGFSDAWIEEQLTIDAPVLRTGYGIDASLGFLGLPSASVRAHFKVEACGLGWSLVEGTVPFARLRMRHFILPTPIDETHIDLRLASSIKGTFLPGIKQLMHFLVAMGLRKEVFFDAPIWNSKRYVTQPALAKGDGPIIPYRLWAKQFYAEPAASG
ncbi:MAG: Rieske 2Fe-2S domain-containing protein [Myxococcota bacterium]